MSLNKKLMELINECCSRDIFPGANLCLITKEREIFISSGNRAILPNVDKNDLSTIYDIASLTKVVVTTTLIMQLIEKKHLSLDTKVKEIIKEFKLEDITILDLLTHTSGLPADIKLDLNSNIDIVKEKIFKCNSIYEKGKDILYSDLGFILLGFIIEEVTNSKLEQIAKESIFHPLTMDNTNYHVEMQNIDKVAPTEISPHFNKLLRGEVHDRKAYLMGGVSGHAGVFSTIKDLSKFTKMILNDGVYNGRRILSKDSVEKLFLTYASDDNLKRGIGYITYNGKGDFSNYNSNKTIYHTGFTGTSMLIDKGNNLAIILLSNRVHPYRKNIKLLAERKIIHEKIMQLLKE